MTDKIQGHITPRMSWPRPATPTNLQPQWAGEFSSFDDWVNFARQRLTGTIDPLTGGEVGSVCVDAHGRRCTIGAHFHRARDEGAFPVRFFWDCAAPATPYSDDDLRTLAELREALADCFADHADWLRENETVHEVDAPPEIEINAHALKWLLDIAEGANAVRVGGR